MEGVQEKNNQDFWHFFFAVFFVTLFFIGMWILYRQNGFTPQAISWFDLFLVILASFRLTRLFVYDKIMRFFRNWFMDSRQIVTSSGDVLFVREKPIDGPRRTVSDLLSCPWCTGMWFGFFTTFFYFLTPFAWYAILCLAVAGAASLLQVLANMIGWRAEMVKQKTEEETGQL